MSQFLRVLIGIVLVASVSGCSPSVNVEQERTALMAADREWSQLTTQPDKFVGFFADGGSIYPPGMPKITGGEAIKKAYTEMTQAPGFALSWTPTSAEVAASGDIGYTTGTYQSSMGGVKETGKYVTVWRKQAGGGWKVTDDIFNPNEMPKPPAGEHTLVAPGELKWGEAPPGLPAGAKAAIVSGDPSQPQQPFVIRAQMPANYRIPPHWHPTTESITVLSGTVAVGMGDKFDEKAMKDVPNGGFATVPADMHHYFMSKTAATIQVHGIGPFAITYVNQADDPRTKKSN